MKTLKVRIIEEDTDLDPASRQKLVRGWNQEKVKNSKIMIVGAGALGNEIVKNLIQMGLGTIYIVDFDYIVHANLNRCIFFLPEDADKKMYKTDAIAKNALKHSPYPYQKIIPINSHLEELKDEDWKNVDIAVSALDSLEARLTLNSICYSKGIPLIDGGMDGFMGYVQVVIPPYTSCLNCAVTDKDLAIAMERLTCAGRPLEITGIKIAALPTTNSVIAGIMSQEIIKLILGYEEFRKKQKFPQYLGESLAGKRLFYNGLYNVFAKVNIDIDENCYIH